MQTSCRLFAVLLLLVAASSLHAGVGDPTIQTSHPQYAGEGAFQTVEQCVAYATAGKKTDQEKAIALFQWILAHQFHLMSPQEWNVPGKVPNTAKEGDQEMICYDANRARFSYAYALCGTVHAWNEPYWKALGMNARRRAFPGHTNSEIEYGGAWHTFDTDMAGLVFRKDGVVACYEDIMKDLSCLDNDHSPIPRYPFAWPSDFQGMKGGWKEIAKGGNWYKMYHAGYAAQPGIVHLRSGETFTRYFDRDHFGGQAQRRFWHNMKGGPFRDWTFVNMGEPEHTGAKSNCRGNASYCNGEFVYQPNLGTDAYKEGVAEQSPNVGSNSASPKLGSKDGKDGSVVFQHFSPYVIAGMPVDGANPMTGAATGGFIVKGQAAGSVRLEVSVDQGQTWKPAGEVKGEFEKDLTDDVKGRYGWQVRVNLTGKDGLDAVTFTTVTQVAQTIYPRLKADGCAVTYRSASRAVRPVLPNFGLAEDAAARSEEKSLRSDNVVYTGPRTEKTRFAYTVKGPKPGWIVFKVAAPADLLQVSAAARFNVRVPPPDTTDYHLEISTDGGKTWKPFAKAEMPKDNDFSSAWMFGNADVAAAKQQTALVKVHIWGGGNFTGMITAELYGVYATPPPSAVKLTYAWKEGGAVKTHVENVPAGKAEWKFTVPTGKQITDEYVRMEAP
jgi:hypothetical protein